MWVSAPGTRRDRQGPPPGRARPSGSRSAAGGGRGSEQAARPGRRGVPCLCVRWCQRLPTCTRVCVGKSSGPAGRRSSASLHTGLTGWALQAPSPGLGQRPPVLGRRSCRGARHSGGLARGRTPSGPLCPQEAPVCADGTWTSWLGAALWEACPGGGGGGGGVSRWPGRAWSGGWHLRLLRPWPDNVASSGQQPRPTGKPHPALPGLAPDALRLPGVGWGNPSTPEPTEPSNCQGALGPPEDGASPGQRQSPQGQAHSAVGVCSEAGPSWARSGLRSPSSTLGAPGPRGHRGPMPFTRSTSQSPLASPF